MVAGNWTTVRHESEEFNYKDACQVAKQALERHWEVLVVDLSSAVRTSTAALARLILLRRNLLQRGGDLRIVGLTGRARALYEINRMTHLLPNQQELVV